MTARLTPLPSGQSYRVDSPPGNGQVTPQLAAHLGQVLERFAVEAGFGPDRPVGVFLKPGVVGHHKVGRAADIYAVGGLGFDRWKARWDAVHARAQSASPADGRALRAKERHENLGWRLYKALQAYGRWARPDGLPVQLFGPWTRTEGPWRPISDGLLRAHRDHVHVAL
jgi:hypothetical protein